VTFSLRSDSVGHLFLLLFWWQTVQAQTESLTQRGDLTPTKSASAWRLDVSGGYQFFGGLRLIQGKLRIEDSFSWSAALSYLWRSNNRIILTYINQPTELWLNAYGSFEGKVGNRRLSNLTVHYILLGSLQEFSVAGPIRPFAGAQLGIATADPKSSRWGTETRWAVSVTGGVRGMITSLLGWKVQATLLVPILWTEGGLFCGPGGCSIGLAGGSAILQMHTHAGLTFSF